MTVIYHPFAKELKKNVTNTLLTKVILGTMGSFPALDEYFKAGYEERFKSKVPAKKVPAKLDATFIEGILQFCRENVEEFQREQAWIESKYRMRCPLMKLVDAYFHQFHQIGLEIAKEAEKKEKEAKRIEKEAKKKRQNERQNERSTT
jgi:hypothetical protein